MPSGPANTVGTSSRAVQNVISPVGAEISSAQTGSFRGESVRHAFVNSKLTEAAQSGSGFTHQVDFRTIALRKARQGQGVNYDTITRIADYHRDKLPDIEIDKGALKRLINLVREGATSHAAISDPTLGDSEQFLKDNASLLLRTRKTQVEQEGDLDDTAIVLPQAEPDVDAPPEATPSKHGALRDPTRGDAERFAKEHGSQIASSKGRRRGPQGPEKDSAKARLFDALRNMSGGDVTHEHAIVEMLREYFEAEFIKETRKEEGIAEDEYLLGFLEEVSSEFEVGDLPSQIQAGYAAARIAHQQAATLETNPALVRSTYREMLRDKEVHFSALFKFLAKFESFENNFEKLVATFMQIAGEDLRSTSPSTDETFLHYLLLELGRLKKLQTVFTEASTVVEETKRLMTWLDRDKINPVRVMDGLLSFCSQKSPGLAEALNMINLLLGDTASPRSRLMLANAFWRLHVSVPEEVISEDDVGEIRRQRISLKRMMDGLVDAEEEAARLEEASGSRA